MPEINEPTDLNDLHILAGLDEVKRQLRAANDTKFGYILPECFRVNNQGIFLLILIRIQNL